MATESRTERILALEMRGGTRMVAVDLSLERAENMADVLGAMASSGRLLILAKLHGGPRSVGQLVEETGLAQATVSNHLRLLRQLRLVHAKRQGRQVIYSLADEHVEDFLRAAVRHIAHD